MIDSCIGDMEVIGPMQMYNPMQKGSSHRDSLKNALQLYMSPMYGLGNSLCSKKPVKIALYDLDEVDQLSSKCSLLCRYVCDGKQ